MMIQRLLERSGLTKVELAELYGVSRQTIHYWVAVAPPRAGSYTARMAETITAALENAIARKLLPLGAMDKFARRARIVKMARTLQGLKPAPIN